MKSLQELAAIRDKMKRIVDTREAAHDTTRVVVGMATCGIAAGARPVLNAFTEEIARRELHGVLVTQTGCIGMCQKEPLLDVVRPGEDRVTYGPVKPTDVPRIIADHLINGVVVEDLVVAKIPSKQA